MARKLGRKPASADGAIGVFGERLQWARRRKGLTQAQLATAVNSLATGGAGKLTISRAMIGHLERPPRHARRASPPARAGGYFTPEGAIEEAAALLGVDPRDGSRLRPGSFGRRSGDMALHPELLDRCATVLGVGAEWLAGAPYVPLVVSLSFEATGEKLELHVPMNPAAVPLRLYSEVPPGPGSSLRLERLARFGAAWFDLRAWRRRLQADTGATAQVATDDEVLAFVDHMTEALRLIVPAGRRLGESGVDGFVDFAGRDFKVIAPSRPPRKPAVARKPRRRRGAG